MDRDSRRARRLAKTPTYHRSSVVAAALSLVACGSTAPIDHPTPAAIGPAARAAQPPSGEVTEADVIRVVSTLDPSVRAARADALAAAALRRGVGRHPNPSFSWEREAFSGGEREDALAVTIPIDASSRRAISRRLADALVAGARADAAAGQREAVLAALELYYAVVAETRRVAVRERAVRSVAEAVRVVERRKAAGQSSGYELARVEIEAELATSRLAAARGRRDALSASLAVLLGLEPGGLTIAGDLEPARAFRLIRRDAGVGQVARGGAPAGPLGRGRERSRVDSDAVDHRWPSARRSGRRRRQRSRLCRRSRDRAADLLDAVSHPRPRHGGGRRCEIPGRRHPPSARAGSRSGRRDTRGRPGRARPVRRRDPEPSRAPRARGRQRLSRGPADRHRVARRPAGRRRGRAPPNRAVAVDQTRRDRDPRGVGRVRMKHRAIRARRADPGRLPRPRAARSQRGAPEGARPPRRRPRPRGRGGQLHPVVRRLRAVRRARPSGGRRAALVLGPRHRARRVSRGHSRLGRARAERARDNSWLGDRADPTGDLSDRGHPGQAGDVPRRGPGGRRRRRGGRRARGDGARDQGRGGEGGRGCRR